MQRISLSHIKQVIYLSLPMAGSRFLQMLSGFIGMMMAAQLGRQVLAACALINSTLSAALLIFISIIFAVSFVVGQTVGAKEYEQVGVLVQQSLLLSFLLSILMAVLFWFAPDIVRLFRQTPAMVHYVREYFHALIWGAVPILLQACLQQFMYGVLKQRIVIVINLVTLLVIVPVAYVLIFGFYIIPSFGVAGLGYAFAIQSWLGFFIVLGICYYKKEFQVYQLFKRHSHTGLIYFRKVFQVGWPMSAQFGGELLAFFVMAMMVGWLGVNALAAVQVTQQWFILVIVPIFAMSEAAGILIGRAVGAEQFNQLKAIGQASLGVVFALVFVLDVLFLTFPHLFASFYIDVNAAKNQQIMSVIRILFVILTLTLFLDAFRDVTSGLLRGLYDTRFSMRIGLLVMWGLVLPLGYVMAFNFHWGVIGFKFGGNIGLFVGALIIYWRWRNRVREFVSVNC